MGELMDQLFAGGPGLLDLSEKQRAFFQEQQGFKNLRFYLEKLKDEIRRGFFYAIKTMDIEFEQSKSLLIDYEMYIRFLGSPETGPLNENEFRNILCWCGHEPSLTSSAWVKIFQKAVQKQRKWDIYILSKELKYDSEHTFLERIIQETGVAK